MGRVVVGLFATLAFLVVLGTGYTLGLAAGRAERAGASPDLLADLLGRAIPQPRAVSAAPAATPFQEQFRLFWEAWSILERDYLDRQDLDHRKLTHGAIRGMIDAVGDPHTVFLDPVISEQADADLRGGFEGIGVHVDMWEGRLRVTGAVEGSPSQHAGLKAGDLILQANGRDLTGLPLGEAVSLLRGPRGSLARLLVQREGWPAPRPFEIRRAEIKLESVRTRVLDGGIGYVQLTTFASTTPRDLATALTQLAHAGAPGLVLDLRGNPGGFLSTALAIADEFVDEGVLAYQEQADGRRQEYRAKSGGRATGVPIAVLIDTQSASAAEIVAGAIRDHGRGVLVGEPTYGKGTVQQVHELADKSSLRVTVGRWLTPREQPLHGRGLQPDLLVPPAPDRDAPLDRALHYLRAR